MSDHQPDGSGAEHPEPTSIPTDRDVVHYARAIGDFRNDHSNDAPAYLAAVIDAALLFVNPQGAMCPELDMEAHAEFWAFGAAIWVQILDLVFAGEEVTYDRVLQIVHDRYEYEFGDSSTAVAPLERGEDVFGDLIRREFGEDVPARAPVKRSVRAIVDLIAGPATSLVERWTQS